MPQIQLASFSLPFRLDSHRLQCHAEGQRNSSRVATPSKAPSHLSVVQNPMRKHLRFSLKPHGNANPPRPRPAALHYSAASDEFSHSPAISPGACARSSMAMVTIPINLVKFSILRIVRRNRPRNIRKRRLVRTSFTAEFLSVTSGCIVLCSSPLAKILRATSE